MKISLIPLKQFEAQVKFEFANGYTVAVTSKRVVLVYPTDMTENNYEYDFVEGPFEPDNDFQVAQHIFAVAQRPKTKFRGD